MSLPDWVSGGSRVKLKEMGPEQHNSSLHEVIQWECSILRVFVLTVVDYITSSYVSTDYIYLALIQYRPAISDVAMLSIRV